MNARTWLKRALLLCFLVLGGGLHAQSWSLYNEGETMGFGNDRFLEAEAYSVYGSDTLFPLFYRIAWDSTAGCMRDSIHHWLGKWLLKQPNGIFLTENQSGDTLEFRTQDTVGTTWDLLPLSGGRRVQAQIISQQADTLFGRPDSVKTIRLNTYDLLGSPLPHPADSMTFQISRNLGFLDPFEWLYFPEARAFNQNWQLESMTGRDSIGFTYLSRRQIFSMDPGDTIHYSYGWTAGGLGIYDDDITWRIFWVDSVIWGNQDQVCRIYGGQMSRRIISGSNPVYAGGNYFLEYTGTQLSHPGYVPGKRYEGLDELVWPMQMDISRNEPSTNPDYRPVGRRATQANLPLYAPIAGDSCLGPSPAIPPVTFDGFHYIEGLGGPWYDWEHPFGGLWRKLAYYQKGSEVWGTPFPKSMFTVDAASPTVSLFSLKAFPNPAREQLHLRLELSAPAVVTISVYDLFGREIVRNENPSTSVSVRQTLEISGWSPGMYFVKASHENGQEKVIKVQVVK